MDDGERISTSPVVLVEGDASCEFIPAGGGGGGGNCFLSCRLYCYQMTRTMMMIKSPTPTARPTCSHYHHHRLNILWWLEMPPRNFRQGLRKGMQSVGGQDAANSSAVYYGRSNPPKNAWRSIIFRALDRCNGWRAGREADAEEF